MTEKHHGNTRELLTDKVVHTLNVVNNVSISTAACEEAVVIGSLNAVTVTQMIVTAKSDARGAKCLSHSAISADIVHHSVRNLYHGRNIIIGGYKQLSVDSIFSVTRREGYVSVNIAHTILLGLSKITDYCRRGNRRSPARWE